MFLDCQSLSLQSKSLCKQDEFNNVFNLEIYSEIKWQHSGRWHLTPTLIIMCFAKGSMIFVTDKRQSYKMNIETMLALAFVHRKSESWSFLFGCFWLSGADNMLVKYSSNYCRCGVFLVLRDDILNDIQETIWSVPYWFRFKWIKWKT